MDWDKILSANPKKTEVEDYKSVQNGNLTKSEILKSTKQNPPESNSNSYTFQKNFVATVSACNENLSNCIDKCRDENPYSGAFYFFTSSFVDAKRNACYDKCRDTSLTLGCNTRVDDLPYNEYSNPNSPAQTNKPIIPNSP